MLGRIKGLFPPLVGITYPFNFDWFSTVPVEYEEEKRTGIVYSTAIPRGRTPLNMDNEGGALSDWPFVVFPTR